MKRALPVWISRLLQAYYHGPSHPGKLRLWYAVWHWLGEPLLTIPYAEGGWLSVDLKDWLQERIFMEGAYEPEVWAALAQRAVDGEVVWDVGAHIGSLSVRAAMDPRIAEIHAFEPNPRQGSVLARNSALNRDRIQCHHIALSDAPAHAQLFLGPQGNTGQSSMALRVSDYSVEVECVTADALVFERGVPAPTLLKIDVEGYEGRVLRGAARLLRERPPQAIVIEAACDSEGIIVEEGVEALLEGAGYQCRRLRRASGVLETRENFLAILNPALSRTQASRAESA